MQIKSYKNFIVILFVSRRLKGFLILTICWNITYSLFYFFHFSVFRIGSEEAKIRIVTPAQKFSQPVNTNVTLPCTVIHLGRLTLPSCTSIHLAGRLTIPSILFYQSYTMCLYKKRTNSAEKKTAAIYVIYRGYMN